MAQAADPTASLVGAERKLLDYWWNHGSEIDSLSSGVEKAAAFMHDLRAVLRCPCPTAAAVRCTVNHEALAATESPASTSPVPEPSPDLVPAAVPADFDFVGEPFITILTAALRGHFDTWLPPAEVPRRDWHRDAEEVAALIAIEQAQAQPGGLEALRQRWQAELDLSDDPTEDDLVERHLFVGDQPADQPCGACGQPYRTADERHDFGKLFNQTGQLRPYTFADAIREAAELAASDATIAAAQKGTAR